jgi:hypothetical protein
MKGCITTEKNGPANRAELSFRLVLTLLTTLIGLLSLLTGFVLTLLSALTRLISLLVLLTLIILIGHRVSFLAERKRPNVHAIVCSRILYSYFTWPVVCGADFSASALFASWGQ